MNKYILGGIVILLLLAGGLYFKGQEIAPGSVNVANEYHGYTMTATTSPSYLFKTGVGTFGSIIISTLGAGNVVFYDASSTIPTQRTIQATSSLPIVATIGVSQAAGTYTYDAVFFNGLIAVFSGAQGSSTITIR